MIGALAHRRPPAIAWASLLVCAALGCNQRVASTSDEATPRAQAQAEATRPLPPPYTERFEGEGLVIELEAQALDPEREGLTAYENARFRFTITDQNGAPVVGAYPAAWMQRRAEGAPPPDAEACTTKVERYLEGSLFGQPDIDLNIFTVLVMNDDASLSVVDPRFGFGGTKLLTMVPLEAPPYDWAITEGDGRLFVSVPMTGQVVFVETHGYRVVADVQVGSAAAKHLLLQPDEHYLWAAGGGQLVAIDVRTQAVAARLDFGTQLGEMAISDDSRQLFVSDRARGVVGIIDTATLSVRAEVETGWEPISMDWSEHAQALYVANRGEGTVSIVDPQRADSRGQLTLEAGLGELRFAPGDRYGFVLNPKRNLVHIFDSATQTVLQSGAVQEAPNHVAFSNELAYIRHGGSDTIYMIHLDALGPGMRGSPLQVVDFPAGYNPLGPRTTPAAGIVKAPGHSAVLVAHDSDRAVYFYKEGMAAPMGQFQNYKRRARAVLTVDRSLEETEARGRYETSARLVEPGTYDLALFIDSPQLVHCFSVEVAENPQVEAERAPPVLVQWQPLPNKSVPAGSSVELRVRLLDGRTREPIVGASDVRFALQLATPEATRDAVVPEDVGDGHYRATWNATTPGPYEVRASAPSVGLTRQSARPLLVLVAPRGEP